MIKIVKSRTKAIQVAKKKLREKTEQDRLKNVKIKNTSCQCVCGEAQAIQVETFYIKWYYPGGVIDRQAKTDYEIVGICKNCGED